MYACNENPWRKHPATTTDGGWCQWYLACYLLLYIHVLYATIGKIVDSIRHSHILSMQNLVSILGIRFLSMSVRTPCILEPKLVRSDVRYIRSLQTIVTRCERLYILKPTISPGNIYRSNVPYHQAIFTTPTYHITYRAISYFHHTVPSYCTVRRLGGDTEYPLAGLLISLVLGDYSLWTSADVGQKQLYYSQSRDGIWRCGLSPVSFHDTPEYKTPS